MKCSSSLGLFKPQVFQYFKYFYLLAEKLTIQLLWPPSHVSFFQCCLNSNWHFNPFLAVKSQKLWTATKTSALLTPTPSVVHTQNTFSVPKFHLKLNWHLLVYTLKLSVFNFRTSTSADTSSSVYHPHFNSHFNSFQCLCINWILNNIQHFRFNWHFSVQYLYWYCNFNCNCFKYL